MHFEVEPREQEAMGPLTNSEELKPPAISLSELEAICEGSPVLEKLLGIMLKSCIEYTISVANWKKKMIQNHGQIDEEFQELDDSRRSIHNRAIDDINILSRALAKNGKDNSWMSTAGMDGKNRAAYMRFAISMSLSRLYY
jgi:hypothetical protein